MEKAGEPLAKRGEATRLRNWPLKLPSEDCDWASLSMRGEPQPIQTMLRLNS